MLMTNRGEQEETKMDQPSKQQAQTVNQLRMGLLGTLTAVVLCFAAAYGFSATPNPSTDTNAVSSTD